MSAMHVGEPGQPVGGWSSAPPPVVSTKQRKADTKVRVILVVIFGLFVFGVFYLMDVPRTNPEDTVRQYLTYLSEGDAESARAMLTAPLVDDELPLVTNEVLGAAESRIVIESVESLTSKWRAASRATVRATMSLNGERFTHDFTVYHHKPTKDQPTEWYLFDDLLVTIHISGNQVPGVSVMGSGADAIPLADGSRELRIFPGVYTFTAEGLAQGDKAAPQQAVIMDGTGTSPAENTSVHFTVTKK